MPYRARKIQGGETVEKTGRQPPQTAVAQTRVGFAVLDQVVVHAEFGQNVFHVLLDGEIHQVVPQSASHQKLGRQVEGLLAALVEGDFSGVEPIVEDELHHRVGNLGVEFLRIGLFKLLSVMALQPPQNAFLELDLVDFHAALLGDFWTEIRVKV